MIEIRLKLASWRGFAKLTIDPDEKENLSVLYQDGRAFNAKVHSIAEAIQFAIANAQGASFPVSK